MNTGVVEIEVYNDLDIEINNLFHVSEIINNSSDESSSGKQFDANDIGEHKQLCHINAETRSFQAILILNWSFSYDWKNDFFSPCTVQKLINISAYNQEID